MSLSQNLGKHHLEIFLLKALSFRTRLQTITYSQIQPHDLLWPLAPCNPCSQQCHPQQFWDSDFAILLLPANNRNEVRPHISMENRIMFLWNASFLMSVITWAAHTCSFPSGFITPYVWKTVDFQVSSLLGTKSVGLWKLRATSLGQIFTWHLSDLGFS